jgi:chorismate-pyruvate lyase
MTLESLYAEFPESAHGCPSVEMIPGPEMPEPYRSLLVHTHHMTVTVERFYGDLVDVEVDEVTRFGDRYARKIFLRLQQSQRVVQFGIVSIQLPMLNAVVRAEILAGEIPLGRVLIQHDVLREVQPVGYFRVILNEALARRMNMTLGSVSYGRLGVITTDGQPAIRVAEILTPISDAA